MLKPAKPLEQVYAPFILAIVATAVGSFVTYNFFVLGVFVLVALAYIVRRYDARILIGLALLLLFLGMLQQFLKQPVNAAKAGNVAYYFLSAGLACEVFWYLWGPVTTAIRSSRIKRLWPGR